ncbi:MAG: NAD(P)/FAD-dependent oxidoreductase [Acidobacteriia bacterium]|nr:NAD(P)/FAD-dependent oxidoreductase [Terriglobia bacterium]
MSTISRRGFVKGAALAPLAFTPFSLQAQAAAPADRFDVVVAGAGHNSLITTAYLAKAGYRCLVLEGRPIVGGCVKTAELTLRGFKHDTCSSAHTAIFDNPLIRDDELKLGDYGLEYIYPDPVIHRPFPDGSYITQWRDLDRTVAEFAKFSKKDAATYRRMMAEYEAVAPIFDAVTFAPVGFGKSLNDRLAEHPRGKYWQRRIAMAAWDIIRDSFEDDHCRAFMLASPWSNQPAQFPMTGRTAYGPFQQQRHSRPLPKGGSGELTQALARFIEAHHGVVLTNKPVQRLIVENGKCAGVECTDGSSYRADKAVLSTMHIKQLVDMAPRELWGEDFMDGVNTWQPDAQAFETDYATTEPPKYPVQGGTLLSVHTELMSTPERALRFAYDYSIGVVDVDDPPLHVICCSIADPTRAPAGMHTVKVLGYQPYDIKEGPQHWDAIKEEVSAANLKYLRQFVPNLTDDKILARIVHSPLDMERQNPMNWQGSIHAGSQGPAQSGAMRPVPGWAQHRMPIPGLYQTGATTFPGGSVTGAPGRNAAVVMLKDWGTSIEQVLQKKT